MVSDEKRGNAIQPAAVDLYWIPLGAGAHVVRVSGRLFETVSALVQRRRRCDLYHSALQVRVPEGRFVIEQTPVPDGHGGQRGVVAEGPVGTRWAGRFRHFRYEIRRWREGRIPDINEAIASPVRLTDDVVIARRILDLLPSVPVPVWGRDELDAGEMWNSNSVIAWVLARCGADMATVQPPTVGRAPGWNAGLVVASRRLQGDDAERLPSENGPAGPHFHVLGVQTGSVHATGTTALRRPRARCTSPARANTTSTSSPSS